MKSLFTIVVVFIAIYGLKAQDIIVKNDKTELKAKIEEITETTIKYKKWEMLDGPIYNISVNDVFMIIYKNGTKEYVKAKESIQPIVENKIKEKPNSTVNKGTENDKIQSNSITSESELIVIKDGRYYYKGNHIKSTHKIDEIFAMSNATDSQKYINKRNVMDWTGLGMVSLGVVGLGVFKSITSPLGIFSATVGITGVLLRSTSGRHEKTAINLYNRMIEDKQKLSFKPMLKNDQMGNHVGISIGF